MYFSTVKPPRPSLLLFVTNGPTLLEQPVIMTAVILRDATSNFLIPFPEFIDDKYFIFIGTKSFIRLLNSYAIAYSHYLYYEYNQT